MLSGILEIAFHEKYLFPSLMASLVNSYSIHFKKCMSEREWKPPSPKEEKHFSPLLFIFSFLLSPTVYNGIISKVGNLSCH